ncbi:DUF4352 domain-containing protein [Alkalithermobacter thermoalcaliphilus]|uniref:DUF4352 domain-containing protein n=1 Tax=Clostridium paradoxum TaxID=29346 RepID=UPI003A7F2FC4
MIISVTNNDKEARTLDTSLFKLTDSEGRTYDPDATADIYVNGQNMFFLDKINPNLTKTGYIVFDLADPNAEYILNVTGGMFSREKEAISLK